MTGYVPPVWAAKDRLDHVKLNAMSQGIADMTLNGGDPAISTVLQDPASESYAAVESTIDAHLGGDATGLVTTVAGKVAKDTVTINLPDHVAANDTEDQTSALQAFFDNTVPDGAEVLLPKGTWRVDGTVTIAASNVTVRLRQGHVWDRSHAASGTETQSAIILSGDNATVKGTGQIKSPAFWDGTNSAWTDAVIKCTGASPAVKQVQLVNVPRVGVGFSNCNGVARALDLTITGNYPSAQWTEVETVHFGVAYDPGPVDARLLMRGCEVTSCVQGCCPANLGAGSSTGSIITGNIFTLCWNHGVYNSGGMTDMVVSNNAFRDCSRPIVMEDSGHIITGNTLTASSTGSTLYWTAAIQMRNAIDCIVSDNVIKGDLYATAAAIDFSHVSGGTTISGNECNNNRIKLTTANTGYAIRMGTTASTIMSANQIKGNIIEGACIANSGLIAVSASPSATDTARNIIDHNTVLMLGGQSGIYITNLTAPAITFNTVQLGFDAASATVCGGVWLVGTVSSALVAFNTFITTAAYGANVTLRCVWENASTITRTRIVQNPMQLDTTKATVSPFILSGGGATLDETGIGVPAFVCGPGSQWLRTDGGTGSTLYVKESAANQSTWTAK